MIRYKHHGGERDFPRLHPELQAALRRFDAYSAKEGLPDPVVTETIRSVAGNTGIYLRFWKKLQEAMRPTSAHPGQVDLEDDGTFRPLNAEEISQAHQVQGLTEAQLLERAGLRFTWHFCACAVDLRTHHYRPTELRRVRDWFTRECPHPLWEIRFHDVTAPHLHVGRRDFVWRTRLMATARSAGS